MGRQRLEIERHRLELKEKRYKLNKIDILCACSNLLALFHNKHRRIEFKDTKHFLIGNCCLVTKSFKLYPANIRQCFGWFRAKQSYLK